ncbi:MAG: hypothetical protein ABI642_17290 [Polaromonas sp.]
MAQGAANLGRTAKAHELSAQENATVAVDHGAFDPFSDVHHVLEVNFSHLPVLKIQGNLLSTKGKPLLMTVIMLA